MKDRSAYNAAYRAANREKARARTATWRAENKDRERRSTAAYRDANRATLRLRYKQNYRKFLDARKRLAAEYKSANREAYRVYHLNRRVRLANGKLSTDIVQTLMARQECRCVYCFVDLNKAFHIDHIMPLALGGSNTDGNVQLLCPPCNMAKSAKHPDEFRAEIA